jgi:glycosyltransferase involved in cell wall biosynthesis
MHREHGSAWKRIALVGTYVPRRCGIATFTHDLAESLARAARWADVFAVAVTEGEAEYAYPPRVRYEIREQQLDSYQEAADFLNAAEVDIVCVQHEYGIYGGPAGSHLLHLLNRLDAPVVTTLHTVLRQPDPQQRRVLVRLAQRSEKLVVMTQKGRQFLREIFHIPEEKIAVIPHGIPDWPFVDPNFYKDRFGLEGRLVLLTFGLLSANKGIENVLLALPQIAAKFPQVCYVVLGATHPNVRRVEGEAYREKLLRLTEQLGLVEHVRFVDRFVELEELLHWLSAADIYITPYLNQEQITSGTLAYSVGLGKAVISTPYWHAEELLAEGRGVLVPFRDPASLADAVLHLLEHDAERHALRKRAYLYGRHMTWAKVAEAYLACCDEIFRRGRQALRKTELASRESVSVWYGCESGNTDWPEVGLCHLRRLTDTTGLLQHARYALPLYESGYTTDDNARGLLACVWHEEWRGEPGEEGPLGERYLAFLAYAFDPRQQRFRNLLSYDRRWLDGEDSDDAQGRALWALGTVIGRSTRNHWRQAAWQLWQQALPCALAWRSPRAWALTLLGLRDYLRAYPRHLAARQLAEELANRLLQRYADCASPDWLWFEDIVAYDNAVLPHGLLAAAAILNRQDCLQVGLESLRWLVRLQTEPQGYLVPIGSQGWYRRGQTPARFDQQPIEAQALVLACLTAEELTGESTWRIQARLGLEWFLGRNDLGLPLYDPETGGCCDGLQPGRINRNQGAESTLAWILARLAWHLRQGRPKPSLLSWPDSQMAPTDSLDNPAWPDPPM